MMDVDEKWQTIAGQRTVLADVLTGLSDRDLDRPSLCARWRVRDVAAHVALTPCSPGLPRILASALRARGDFDEVNRTSAVGHAERLGPALAGELRAVASSRRRPAITTVDNLLFDTIVHVQDVAVPLGVEVDVPPEGAREGADRVWRMGWPFWARRRLRGLELAATDTDWMRGYGEPVRGPIRDLLFLLTGRTEAALPGLHGAGVRHLASHP
ncbi:maleylpyruvate isomerase family mycothiol-dependent enzyme [Actinomycetospora callitridis]|uniref:maleylpyruvate isomerase family mycothiol-dependent enzyme n=1 Tax=Actinomycetospora callitridis TaxID=913944 RepID=UPI002366D263|nr:maleylpyruvate isomerase family mycothiol-dependent enzyme [Actinomycetospora callitridis]MDD7920361.1 maleylpyruvate isomerase family mycothiol-dependent enzyme [Actinomycetospora callitridis]